ncbi:MAG: helix-turn-helix domain-containing protein [Candidatus Rokubacteria bacterium]|nr:helix-turn-helix domain-containing protein [Candidatus Rokubacteria bacterium]
MPGQRPRVFSGEFKEAAVRRILAGEKVRALARELGLWPKLLYAWRNSYARGGPEALLPPGRPRTGAAPGPRPERAAGAPHRRGDPPAPDRVAELERKVGQQALELDFFARALRHIKASPRPSDGPGAAASST